MAPKDDDKTTSPSAIGEFLQPKAMLTPGIAGGLTTLVTNALTSQFGLWPNYTGLAISFLFGLIVFQAAIAIPFMHKIAYYFLNSLVIFSVAMGANQTGVTLTKSDRSVQSAPKTMKLATTTPFFSNWLDGTVPMRQELMNTVGNVNDKQAKDALEMLHVPILGLESPKDALISIISSSRTSDEVNAVHLALRGASSDHAADATAPPEQ